MFLVTRVLLCMTEDDSVWLMPAKSDSVLASAMSRNQDREEGTCMTVRHSLPAATACMNQDKPEADNMAHMGLRYLCPAVLTSRATLHTGQWLQLCD
jgi:hypothetical protein